MQVTAFPTFIFCLPGNPLPKVLGKFSGADPAQLEARIKEGLQAVAGGGAAAAKDEGPVPGQSVIDEFVDTKSIECLNQKDDHPVANIFTSSDTYVFILTASYATALVAHTRVADQIFGIGCRRTVDHFHGVHMPSPNPLNRVSMCGERRNRPGRSVSCRFWWYLSL